MGGEVLTQPGHAYVRSSGHERLRQGSVMVVLSPAWWNGTLWEEMHRTRERDPSQQDISVRACADESSLGGGVRGWGSAHGAGAEAG